MSIILRFEGPYTYLSNLAPAPVMSDGVSYPSVENAFQAAKTLRLEHRQSLTCCTPSFAKRQGRLLNLRPDWEKVKDDIMYNLVSQKFAPGSALAAQLLNTGDAYLCEGNTWHDNYWGACYCNRCLYTKHLNHLGATLMRVRNELRR